MSVLYQSYIKRIYGTASILHMARFSDFNISSKSVLQREGYISMIGSNVMEPVQTLLSLVYARIAQRHG